MRLLPYAADRVSRSNRKFEPGCRRTARLGQDAVQPAQATSAAYAAFSPPLFYADKPGEAKCSHCFIGGNFWDLRATGLRLQSPTAMQAEGSPLNPTEMANPDPACVVRRMSERPYKGLFESVWGPRAFEVAWPDDVDVLCSRPNDNPASSIGSEVPGPNTTPLVVKLGPADRERVQSTFDQMGEAIAAYEASSEVSPFSSKFDAYLAGKVELSEAERRGHDLYNGQAKCLNCHVDPKGEHHPLFTDNTTSNLGVPRNPDLAFYRETQPDAFGYVPNPQGDAFVDKGFGNFLRSPENANEAWKQLAPRFDGRFRVATVRNVDKRPRPEFVKAYMHNGYFKSLKEVVHFTIPGTPCRDAKRGRRERRCPAGLLRRTRPTSTRTAVISVSATIKRTMSSHFSRPSRMGTQHPLVRRLRRRYLLRQETISPILAGSAVPYVGSRSFALAAVSAFLGHN